MARAKPVLLAMTTVLWAASASVRADAPDLAKENADLKAKVDALRKENAELKRQLQAAEARQPQMHFAPADADVAKRYFENLNGNLVIPAPTRPLTVPNAPTMPPGTATHPFNGVDYYVIPCDSSPRKDPK